jgi:hypothetical protein
MSSSSKTESTLELASDVASDVEQEVDRAIEAGRWLRAAITEWRGVELSQRRRACVCTNAAAVDLAATRRRWALCIMRAA